MAQAINPIGSPENRIAQILGDDYLAEAPAASASGPMEFTGNPFEDILSKAVDAMEGVSRSEVYANQLIQDYMQGKVELHKVMMAQSKASLMVQLAVTTINSATSTFKEITQMQI